VRRTLAVGALVLIVGALGWGVASIVRGTRDSAPPVTTLPPPPKPFKIVFPEGFTRRDMAERITAVDGIAFRKRHVRPKLSAAAYLKATAGKTRMTGFGRQRFAYEGFLFPATYDFFKATTSRQLVRSQLEAFARTWSDLSLKYARSKNLTPYDVLIIASMIEKEARAASERPLVAAVIYNRLRLGMTLGIDATIRYALNVPATESLRQSQLDERMPYNTRLVPGLPPTPISNPGLASMQAAARPAKVDYLYFVRKPDKVHHFFTASKAEFDSYSLAHGY
jgi:UPF0755 protein